MRELKFRVWNPLGKRMLYNSGMEVKNNKLISKYIMQFTGFKDKNDKEIYEGDIFYDDVENLYGIIEFLKGSFCVVWCGVGGQLMEYGFDEDAGGYGVLETENLCNIYIDKLGIVGNKFQNPKMFERYLISELKEGEHK